MLKKLFLIITLACPLFAQAQIDYSVDTLVRSYSAGAFLRGKVGYSLPVWGSGILTGFLHPSVTFKSSGTINTAGGRLTFYPISILGVFAGASASSRKNDDLPTFDCTQVVCEADRVNRTHIGFRFALAFKSIFLMSENKKTKIELKNTPNTTFADESVTLFANRTGDEAFESINVFGFKWDDKLSFGLLYKHNEMKTFKNQSNMAILFAKFMFGDYSLLAGPGGFRDRNGHQHATFLATLKWTGEKGLLLF